MVAATQNLPKDQPLHNGRGTYGTAKALASLTDQIYSPLLLVTAALEAHEARVVRRNRLRKVQDDDTVEEWEQLAEECDFEHDGWAKKVEATKPDIEVPQSVAEIRKVEKTLREVKALVVSSVKNDPDVSRDDHESGDRVTTRYREL
jgi:hypothetical protein